jgi:hypothetical protein
MGFPGVLTAEQIKKVMKAGAWVHECMFGKPADEEEPPKQHSHTMVISHDKDSDYIVYVDGKEQVRFNPDKPTPCPECERLRAEVEMLKQWYKEAYRGLEVQHNENICLMQEHTRLKQIEAAAQVAVDAYFSGTPIMYEPINALRDKLEGGQR